MRAIALTDIGGTRPSNQDAYLVTPPPHPLYAVADGMGGEKGGDVASLMAISGLRDMLTGRVPDEAAMLESVRFVNRQIFERQRTDSTLQHMGTTLTALWEEEDSVLVAHVGDSRLYRLRQGVLTQLTRDHSMVAEMCRKGILSVEEAKRHPRKHVITRAVGTEPTVVVDIERFEKLPLDRYLICSDGLTDYLDDEALAVAMSLERLDEAARDMVQAALLAGGRDNVTLIALEVSP